MSLAILVKVLALKNNNSYSAAVWFMNLSHTSQFVKHMGQNIWLHLYWAWKIHELFTSPG